MCTDVVYIVLLTKYYLLPPLWNDHSFRRTLCVMREDETVLTDLQCAHESCAFSVVIERWLGDALYIGAIFFDVYTESAVSTWNARVKCSSAFRFLRTREYPGRAALQVSGKPDTLRTYTRKSAAKWPINFSPSLPQHAGVQ